MEYFTVHIVWTQSVTILIVFTIVHNRINILRSLQSIQFSITTVTGWSFLWIYIPILIPIKDHSFMAIAYRLSRIKLRANYSQKCCKTKVAALDIIGAVFQTVKWIVEMLMNYWPKMAVQEFKFINYLIYHLSIRWRWDTMDVLPNWKQILKSNKIRIKKIVFLQ